jgi:hypothetical protein
MLRNELMDHLLGSSLLNDSQYRFMAKESGTTNLLELVTSAVDNGDSMDLVFLDFVKALGKVPHKGLLVKLRAHGVARKVLKWIEKWLASRIQ